MRIHSEKCVGCGRCADYCMLQCISKNGNRFQINEEECVDCGVCLRAGVCAKDAIYMPEENYRYPRAVRMQFSDPGVQHPALKAWGRGTEEAKTNDVDSMRLRPSSAGASTACFWSSGVPAQAHGLRRWRR